MTKLVVEDDCWARTVVRTRLEYECYRVLVSGTGKEAPRRAQRVLEDHANHLERQVRGV